MVKGDSRSLQDSKRYIRFVSERDHVLEQIHRNCQIDLSRILFEALSQIKGQVASISIQSIKTDIEMHPLDIYSASLALEKSTLEIFTSVLHLMTSRIIRMRKATFILTNLSELEAIGQATQKTTLQTSFSFKQKIKNAATLATIHGDEITERVWISLMKLRSKILDAFRLAMVQRKSAKEVLKKVENTFPNIQSYKKPPRELNPLKEALFKRDEDEDKIKQEVSSDFIDQSDWDLATHAYQDTEIPPSRFDEESSIDPDKGYSVYSWELEQEVRDDFVNQVREGQIDAANELGIKDFVWVAILDDKTDDCCLERAGLTTSEIEEKLENQELDDTECDATTPPAHPNCRCNLAPVSSTDEVEGPDFKSFQEWLDS